MRIDLILAQSHSFALRAPGKNLIRVYQRDGVRMGKTFTGIGGKSLAGVFENPAWYLCSHELWIELACPIGSGELFVCV